MSECFLSVLILQVLYDNFKCLSSLKPKMISHLYSIPHKPNYKTNSNIKHNIESKTTKKSEFKRKKKSEYKINK